MRHLFLAALAVAFCLGFIPRGSAAEVASSQVEIEHLLAFVKNLENARFIRNGTEYSAAEAEKHLRAKWQKLRSKITTAEAFVEQCATRSSMSGEVYQIRLSDGTRRPAAELIFAELARLRAQSPSP